MLYSSPDRYTVIHNNILNEQSAGCLKMFQPVYANIGQSVAIHILLLQ